MPVIISVTSSPTLLSYSLTGPAVDAHRYCKACTVGPDDGLLEAVATALGFLTPRRAAHLLKIQRNYRAALKLYENPTFLPGTRPDPKDLPISIRTSSQRLADAGLALCEMTFNDVPEGLATRLWMELNRFDVTWVLLPIDAAELVTLQRWGSIHFRPGEAFKRGEETRRYFREAQATFERPDQEDSHPVPPADLDESSDV